MNFCVTLAVGLMTPGFLVAGVALASIPIIIHLLNRRRFKIIRWAAMDFLLQAMRKNRRRLRFEQWLLLATRCALLSLLGLALARPLGCNQMILGGLGDNTGLHVFVIDNSYSMAYQADRPNAKTHLDQAKILAKQAIDRLKSGGESVVIITAAAPADAYVGIPTYNLDEAKASIDRIQQSFSGTDMAGALTKAVEIGQKQQKVNRKLLYLLTDGTQGAFGAGLREAEALKQRGAELSRLFQPPHVFTLGRSDQWNFAIGDVRPPSSLVTTRFPTDFTADIQAFGRADQAMLQWKLDNESLPGGGQLMVDVNTPGQVLRNTQFKEGGPHVLTAALIDEEKLREDNTRYRVIDVVSDMRVLIVEGDRGSDPLSRSGVFLETALSPLKEATGSGPVKSNSYIGLDVISDLELRDKIVTDYKVVILANVPQVSEEEANRLQKFVKEGGLLMLFMGESINTEVYNRVMLPRQLMPGKLVARRTDSSTEGKGLTFDFRPNVPTHRLLDLFKSTENSGLDTARVFAYLQLDLAPDSKTEVVLRYQSTETLPGEPAITAHSVDKGRVLFFSTSANAQWTTLPAKPVYTALMHELLAGSVGSGDRWLNLPVGAALEVPTSLRLGASPNLQDPNKKEIPVVGVTQDDGRIVYRSEPLKKPGVYRFSTGKEVYPVAVNIPAEEADIRVLNNEKLKSALGDIELRFIADTAGPAIGAIDEGNDLGWTVMLLVLVLVAAECFMAMHFGHYRKAAVRTEGAAQA